MMNYVHIVNVDRRKMVHIRTGTQGAAVVNNYCCKKFVVGDAYHQESISD